MPAKKLSPQEQQRVVADFQKQENRILETSHQFSKIPYAVTLKAIDSRLSAPAYRLWLYLFASFPFGDREYDLPSQSELAIRLGVSRKTINSAAAEIQRAGLWEFIIKKWKGRNLCGHNSPQVAKVVTPEITRCNELVTPEEELVTPEEESVTPEEESVTPKTPNSAQTKASGASQTIQINFKSSSDLIREEEFKFQEKKAEEIERKQSLALSDPEEEVDQGGELECKSAMLPDPEEELVAPRAPDLNPDAVSLNETSHSHVASLIEKPKLRIEAIDPSVDNPPPPESLNGGLEIDQDLLLWVMEVKLPTMKLNTQPVNVEAYAKGMLRRDGEKLQAEYADVVAEQKFIKKAAELTVQVEARVREWQKVSHAKLTTFHDLDGMPCVLLDGITIGAVDFLAKAVEPAPMVATIPFSPENREARFSRTSRLKLSAKINSNPGFEFLEECWEDFFLQPQVSLILAKHPDWAVVKDGKLCPGTSH